jgi:two-component system phosphate regulon sensor histidine kinase PhoR
MRSSFFWKLASSSVLLILGATLIVALISDRILRDDIEHDLRASLDARVHMLEEIAMPALRGQALGDFEDRVRELGRVCNTRLTVLRADGTVLAESHRDPAGMENHLHRPEIAEAIERGSGRAERESETLGERYSYLALAVPSKDHPLGFVRCAVRMDDVEARLRGVRNVVLSVGAVTALLAVLFALYFTRRFTAPLTEMTESAESIARGDYERSARFEGGDEIGRLSQAFDTMTSQLQERLATITGDRNKVLAILASMVEGVIAVDRDERVVHMNQVAGSVLDVSPERCVGKRIWEVTRVIPVCEILDLVARTAQEASAECQIAADPSTKSPARTVELRASPLRDGSGALAGAVVVLHDVTALRKLENVRRDFVANVSHELKTPLTAIRGLVETLLDDRTMPEETQRRFLEKVRDQAARLSALVVDLLTLARIESNEQALLERRSLDVRGIVRECATRFAAPATGKGLSLETELPETPVIVRADEESLRQIVDNLLDNAVKYTPSGGRVAVRLLDLEREAVLEVADTGIGIEGRDQERVFERFYRVDKARSRELGGTGLGLSIVKHLSLALGGRVSLDSAPGRGSTFRVHLPVSDPSA